MFKWSVYTFVTPQGQGPYLFQLYAINIEHSAWHIVVAQSLSRVQLFGHIILYSTSGFSGLHYLLDLLKFMSTESVMLSISSSAAPFFCPQSFPASGSFPVNRPFTSGGQSIWVSASVLPMNIQGWFPLGLTGLISLLSKGLWRIFSSTTIRKHQFFSAQPSWWSNSVGTP